MSSVLKFACWFSFRFHFSVLNRFSILCCFFRVNLDDLCYMLLFVEFSFSVPSQQISWYEHLLDTHTHTHTHTFYDPLYFVWDYPIQPVPGPIWILLKQETVSGSGISWAICISAPRPRQITIPTSHHSVFTGQMPFLPPNQQRQSTEGNTKISWT